MKPRFRIREDHFDFLAKPFSLFYCEKKVLWFWVPVFEHNRDEGEPPISFSSFEEAEKHLNDYLKLSEYLGSLMFWE